ncbi:Uncharacterized protein ChrSV_1621 [Chromobacterium vaccinii]|nr:Uncharacterized protein ChrSW_1621 [Chromobacterium vaccinii]QND89079.1 Uncharacterized protein ChrSV_1621 [Chromobacterium vaccinii]
MPLIKGMSPMPGMSGHLRFRAASSPPLKRFPSGKCACRGSAHRPFRAAVLCHPENPHYNDENIRAGWRTTALRRGDPAPRKFFEHSRKKRKGIATQ